jgi:hypothetical protein
MNNLCCASAGVLAAVLMTSAAWAGIIIDNFTDTDAYPNLQWVEGATINTFSDTDGPGLDGVFGAGSRTLELQVIAISGTAQASSEVLPLSGEWTTSNDLNANSIARVIYAAPGGATLLPPSSTPSGTLFRAWVTFADLQPALKAILTDVDGFTAEFSWYALETGNVLDALLTDFDLPNNAFDFENVQGITVQMSGPSNWDGAVGLLETTAVPEPSSLLLALAVTCIAGVTAARRRRK